MHAATNKGLPYGLFFVLRDGTPIPPWVIELNDMRQGGWINLLRVPNAEQFFAELRAQLLPPPAPSSTSSGSGSGLSPGSTPVPAMIPANLVSVYDAIGRENALLRVAVATMRHLEDVNIIAMQALHPDYIAAGDVEYLEMVLEGILKVIIDAFDGAVIRASILWRDGDYLTPLASVNYSEETLRRMHFYIGPDDTKPRGVAGTAFVRASSLIVHLSEDGSTMTPDNNAFVFLTPTHDDLTYLSLMVCPLTLHHLHNRYDRPENYGVLCLDSREVRTFDGESIREAVVLTGSRIATVLDVYKRTYIRLKKAAEDT